LPSERDKEEMRMERSNRNGLFDRLKSREEERRLRQMPDERRREYEEQKKAKRTKRSMRSPDLRASFAQAQAGTKLTEHQFNMALDGFPNNDILFFSDRGGQFDLWKMDGSGNNETQLTDDLEIEAINGGVDVSPSGQKIAYVSFDFYSGQNHFYVMNADGSSRIEIDVSSERIDVEDNSWSPNSQWILYEKEVESGGDWEDQIWVAKADGTGKKQLPKEFVKDGRYSFFWSSNSQLTYLHNDRQSSEYGIYTMDVDTLVTATIVTSTTSSFNGLTHSPDGNYIAYVYGGDIYTVSSQGGTPTPIVTSTTGHIYDLAYSPDGNWIAYGYSNGLCKIGSNGGTPIPIVTSTAGSFYDLIWSPDSQWLLYEKNDDDGTWAVRADGTDKNRLLEESWGEIFSCQTQPELSMLTG